MKPAASPQRRIFAVLHVWEEQVEARLEVPAPGRTGELQNTMDVCHMCSDAGNCNHKKQNCPETGWKLKAFHFRYCRTALLGTGKEGVCDGKRYLNGGVCSSRDYKRTNIWKSCTNCVCSEGSPLRLTACLPTCSWSWTWNLLTALVHHIKLYGSVPLVVQSKDVIFFFSFVPTVNQAWTVEIIYPV